MNMAFKRVGTTVSTAKHKGTVAVENKIEDRAHKKYLKKREKETDPEKIKQLDKVTGICTRLCVQFLSTT